MIVSGLVMVRIRPPTPLPRPDPWRANLVLDHGGAVCQNALLDHAGLIRRRVGRGIITSGHEHDQQSHYERGNPERPVP
ncbi:MAG: hypothetical protein EA351_01440 [Gemmatimonadales bacterium]|nr:MAG: hypothetical protein EA351_01440 [Gemmatimonadales bacterium]